MPVPGMGGASQSVEVQLQSTGVGQFTSGFSRAIGKLQSFRGAAAGAGLAAGALGAKGLSKSISAASDFDSAMTESLAIMGDVSDAMRDDMSQAARDVATETTFSADEAAESFFFLASAGLDAKQSVNALPQVAEFAQAGMFDMQQATDKLTDAQSALGLAAEDPQENLENMARVSDTLVGANTLANASVEQFSEALTNKAAPAMDRMGIGVEEGTAALSVFADQGLKGRRAGTIFARTLEGLDEQARNNSEAFEEMGIRVFDAEGEMRPLHEITRDMEGAFEGMSTEQKQAALEQLGFNQRAAQGIDLLMGNADQLQEYESELENAGGTTEEVADKQLQSFNAQLDLLKSEFTDVAISIGQVFLPHLTTMVGHLRTAMQVFSDINDRTNGVAGAIALLGITVGGFLVAATALISLMGGLATVMATATGIVAGLGSAMSLLLGPVGLVIAAVALLAMAWKNNWFGIRDVTSGVVDTVADAVGGFVDWLGPAWNAFTEALLEDAIAAWEGIQNAIEPVVTFLWNNVIQPFLDDVRALWEEHGEVIATEVTETYDKIHLEITRVIDLLRPIIQDFLRFVQRIWQVWGDEILTIVRFVFDTIRGIVVGVLDAVATIIRAMLAIIRGDWKEAWTIIADFFRRTFTNIEEFIGNWGRRFFEWLDGFVGGVLQWFRDLASELIGGSIIPDMLADILGAFRTFGDDTLTWLEGLISGFLRRVGGWASDFDRAVSRAANDVLWTFRDLRGDVIGIIRDLAGRAVDIARGMGESMADALRRAWNRAIPSRVSIPSVTIRGRTFGGGSIRLPRLAEGGIVPDPTAAIIGEAGPEAVIPLNKLEGMVGPGAGLDSDDLLDAVQEGTRRAIADAGLDEERVVAVDIDFQGHTDDPIVDYIRENARIVVREVLGEESRRIENLHNRPSGV